MKLIGVCLVFILGTISSNSLPLDQTSTSIWDEIVPSNFKISDYVELSRNDYQTNKVTGRKDDSIEDNVEEFLKSHDVTVKMPLVDSKVTLTAKDLDNDEVDVKIKLDDGSQIQEGRKSKLKKVIAPILVFILIKAMVLIPLALGILAIKTWNALQLSFVSFVIALAMGVWQLCKKVAGDSAHPQIIAHEPWAAQYAARSIDANEDAQKLAYSAYIQQ